MSKEYFHTGTASYFSNVRKDILPLLPESADRVLEVGCGEGNTLTWIRSIKNCSWIGGIEISSIAAEKARSKLDEVYEGNIESMDLPIRANSIDMILCLDVLEHLVDPWIVISKLHNILKNGGVLIASIPNVRHYSVSLPLLFYGRWEYKASGILDRTHLRFFTFDSAIKLVQCSGLKVDLVKSTGLEWSRKDKILNIMTLSLFKRYFDLQYLIRSTKRVQHES